MNTDQSANNTNITSDESADDNVNVAAATVAAKPTTVKEAGVNKNLPADAIPTKDTIAKGDIATVDIAKVDIAKEFGGPKGLEPTRYGDWEKNGRCSDF